MDQLEDQIAELRRTTEPVKFMKVRASDWSERYPRYVAPPEAMALIDGYSVVEGNEWADSSKDSPIRVWPHLSGLVRLKSRINWYIRDEE